VSDENPNIEHPTPNIECEIRLLLTSAIGFFLSLLWSLEIFLIVLPIVGTMGYSLTLLRS
jgi:uncharacterized membrane protein